VRGADARGARISWGKPPADFGPSAAFGRAGRMRILPHPTKPCGLGQTERAFSPSPRVRGAAKCAPRGPVLGLGSYRWLDLRNAWKKVVIMNAVLMNRDGFQVPADGFYQIAPLGEFGHAQAGVVQVVDAEACTAMVNRFAEEAKAPIFAGLLVDFDHFSLDGEKKSEAAGWITALENRDGGLFAKIRWSDVGESAVKGGRYRFLSPVWTRSDCADLGNGRVRPLRLLNAAVTNDPNLKGMQPMSNRQQASGDSRQVENGKVSTATDANGANAAAGEPRFMWVNGGSKASCPSCAGLAGKVHTQAEWDASGLTPGCGALYCRDACHCVLVPTDEPSGGSVVAGPLRDLTNTGWTDEARAASLAVRRSHMRGRPGPKGSGSGDGGSGKGAGGAGKDSGGSGKSGSDDGGGVKSGTEEDDQAAHEKAADEAEHQDAPPDDTAGEDAADKAADEAEGHQSDDELDALKAMDPVQAFKDKGLEGMTDEQKSALSDQIGQKVRNGEPLTPDEEKFVQAGGMPVSGTPPLSTGKGGELRGPVPSGPQTPPEPVRYPPKGSGGRGGSSTPPKLPGPVAPVGPEPGDPGSGTSIDMQAQEAVQAYIEKGLSGMSRDQIDYLHTVIGQKVRSGIPLTPTEERFVQDTSVVQPG